MPDPRAQKKEIPLNGKWMTDEPAAIGVNFQTLKNYRYTNTHLRGIRGMTEIGGVSGTETDDWGDGDDHGGTDDWATWGTYALTKNAFHFVKSQPVETHLLAQKFNATTGGSAILDCTAVVPASATFSSAVLLANSGNNTGYFCNAPDGKVIWCNGVDTHLWNGTEGICPVFITSEAAVVTGATKPVDYSAVCSNTKDDTENLITIGATALTFLVGSDLPIQGVKLYVKSANTTVGSLSATHWTGAAWTALSITDNTDSPACANTYVDALASVTPWTAVDSTLSIVAGYLSIAEAGGANPGKAYHDVTTVVGQKYLLSCLFQKGTSAHGKIMIGTTADEDSLWDSGNLTDAVFAAHTYEFTASATTTRITLQTNDATVGETSLFDTLSITTGITLAQTGTVTWATTVTTSKPLFLEGYFKYWYQFTITDGDATLYYVTIDAPFQNIVDIWDGVYRQVLRFYKRTTAYLDNTINVMEDDYYVSDTTTYADLSSLGAFATPANCLEIGFEEKQTAIYFNIAPDYTNSTAATTAAVAFWDGGAYTTCGTIVDGTSEGAISMAKPGVMSWNSNALTGETVKVVANSPPLYFYQVSFDKAMDASVRVNYVGGITAQKAISYYKFPVFAQGRVFLCADMSQSKNMATCSGKFTPQVFNGFDSVNLFFGNDGELTCGIELFSLFGSSLYSIILFFKDNETWIITGANIEEWADTTFLLSNSIGCPAPLTLKTINLSSDPGAGINRALAIWQASNGIYMSDGRAPIPIHGDIAAYFDPQDSRCIRASMVGDSVGEIDSANQIYYWMFASGSSATGLNKELGYDIIRNKWFEVDRGANKRMNFLLRVYDTDGNAYLYGFRDNGAVYRLEYGATFDGEEITHTYHTGDISLGGLSVDTQVDRVRQIAVSRSATSDRMTLTHYGDTATVGTDKIMEMFESDKRVVQDVFTDKLHGDSFHSFKGVTTTVDEATGPEPLALVVTYHPTHQD